MNFDGPEFTYEELKEELREATGRDEWILRQLARGLRPIEIENHPRSDYSAMQVRKVFQEHMGEDASAMDCRKALFQHLSSGLTTEEDAEIILDFQQVKK